MPEPTTLPDLIAAIRAERALLEDTLAKVPAERIDEAGVVGNWSVKDILAHLAVWQSRAITMLFQAERSGKPVLPETQLGMKDIDKINARDFAEQRERPLDRIQADYRGTHVQLVKRLEAWQANAAALFDASRYAGMNGQSLAAYVHGDSAEHDAEHRAHIEAWLAQPA